MAITSAISPPEPDLTAAEVVARRRAAAAAARRAAGGDRAADLLPAETHEEFLEAGSLSDPRAPRYGGYEFDLPTFWRVVIAIARGCPSTAWCLCLAAAHALQVGSSSRSRRKRSSSATAISSVPPLPPRGWRRRTEDGWELNSTHPYSSGAPYSTHYMGQTFVPRRSRRAAACCSSWRRGPSGRCSTTGATRSG